MTSAIKTVGRYEVLREVGRGGMAIVHLARQTDLDRFVALKELAAFHAADHSIAQRFLNESRVAGSLSHPNIVTVHGYFEHDGTPYIAMEYVERGSLRPYVGQLSLAQIGGVLEGLLAGLAHAEQHGIVHRDLKPENLMVTADGRVKITDFGIAKATTKMQTGAFLTATGTTVGTPTYMAPEQAMGQEIGPWTDLYSVGCMAFELFTGRVPFHDSEAPMAILLRHVNEPIPPLKSIDSSIDGRVSDWVERLLVKDPRQRTQSAADAWDDLEEIMIALLGPRWRREARLPVDTASAEEPKPLTPAQFETSVDPPARPDSRERRSRFPLVVAGVVAVAALAGFLLAGAGGSEAKSAEPIAVENDTLRLQVPADWTRATTLPAVPGLTLDDATGYTAPDGGTVMFGTAAGADENAALLQSGLIEAAGGVPEQRTPVALGPDQLQAYRYSDVELEGLDRPVSVYAVPTSKGVATVACLPGGATCEGIANTFEVLVGEPRPVGPSGGYAQAVEDALGELSSDVDQEGAALRRARTPGAQAKAAGRLAAAYRRAYRALPRQQLNPADHAANQRLIAALNDAMTAYKGVESAAGAGSKARYDRAAKAVTAAQRDIDDALAGLRAVGYEVRS